MRWSLWIVLMMGACAGHDLGSPCFVVPDEVGEPLKVTLTTMGGDRPPRITCAVDGTANDLTLTSISRARFDPTPFTQNDILIATFTECASPPLVAGPGTLTFAGQTMTFSVPGDGETVQCLDPNLEPTDQRDTDPPVDTDDPA